MRLSMPLNYVGGFEETVRQVATLEKAGLDVVWVAEAYGFDAVSLMGYLAARTETVEIGAAILPIYSRTPTLLAMTAAGVDSVSNGRCILGLGASGPQVIEGFHGVPYDRPLARTREIIEICRKVWKRDAPVTYDGACYTLPLSPGEGTGLGKPLKLITHPVRDRIPIFVASLGEKNVALTAEVADGWLPFLMLPEKAKDVWGRALARGQKKRSPDLAPLEISAGGLLAVVDEKSAPGFRDFMRPMVALYVGGMGAKGKNFYNELVRRYGYEKEAAEIQDLYLDGHKNEAAAKVPTELLEAITMVGPEGYVKDRIAAFREAGVTMLNVIPIGADPVALMGQVKEWVS